MTVAGGGHITKDTYTNGGWNTADDGSGDDYTAGDTFPLTEDTTLFVKWNEIRVTGVSLSKSAVTLERGDSVTLTATVRPSDASDKTVTWASSDTNVATVGSSGKVTAVAEGKATITAKAGGKSGTCVVTVEEEGSSEPTPTPTPAATPKPTPATTPTPTTTPAPTPAQTEERRVRATNRRRLRRPYRPVK